MFLMNKNNFRKLAYVEIGKYHKASFLKAAQKLVPALTIDNMSPTPKVGIRPQLINIRNNQL
jgi:L-2-hydroxyglutarate oxidase